MNHAVLGTVVLGLIILLVPTVEVFFKLAMAITGLLLVLIVLGHGDFHEMMKYLLAVLPLGLVLFGLALIVRAPFGKWRKKE